MLKNLKNFSLPEIEEKILSFWNTNHIFERTLQKNEGKGETFVFFEGPPTANGRPGIHHVLARTFKDIIPRYKTMRGFHVPRRAGWDTHGLPVEIEVEKELGLKQKQDIEKFGIAEFNARAKDLIWKYRAEWEDLTRRMGYWIDLSSPYITYENSYIESVWWLFSEIYKKGYLKKLLKTVPWCFRCQTPLSSHELGQPGAYKPTKDPSVFVKFKIRNSRSDTPEFLLAWTTTPWTLPANLAVAVHPKLTYTKFLVEDNLTQQKEYLWSFNPPPALPHKKVSVIEKMSGRKLVGTEYEPLFKLPSNITNQIKKAYQVWAGEFVSTEDGSGLVHIAPSFGEEDFKLMGIKEGLPVTIDDQARVVKGFPGGGKYIKEADKEIVADLKSRNLLYFETVLEHEYPYCWRCSNPLIYMVRESWFIEMSKLKAKMLAANEKINWIPAHLKQGRFGEWLKDIKDWSISRNRYWGTPLPIWECEKCQDVRVIGSLEELDKASGSTNTFFAVRHGEASHNVAEVFASGPERGGNVSDLTEKGEAQIESLAAQLKKEKIDLIVASPYLRTQRTAKAIAKMTRAKVVTDKRLQEINTGIFNWRAVKDYRAHFANPIDRFFKAPPGGETLRDVRSRVMDLISDLNKKHENKRIVIVSHGDPLWILEGALRGFDEQELLHSVYEPAFAAFKKLTVRNLPYDKQGAVDLHRPFIDNIMLACKKCKGTSRRIKDVADVWFDAGAMPFASLHFPFAFLKEGKAPTTTNVKPLFKKLDHPADYISEGVDQTRGWFYTLLAISVLMDKGISYKNVISLGLIHDKHGVKMSKSKGNIVSPWDMMKKYGADAVRWYFYTVNDPGEPKNFDEEDIAKATRRFILILYNSYVFWNTYAHESEALSKERSEKKNVLDRWISARLHQLVADVTKLLDKYQIGEAGRLIESFVDDLSRWYIRRSRDRFQERARGGVDNIEDWEQASFTLRQVLRTLSRLLAPFMPFFADALYQSLSKSEPSVHLENWPAADKNLIDNNLLKHMEIVRSISAEVLALRATSHIKVRQPLPSITLKDRALQKEDELLELLKNEVNVKEIKFDPKLTTEHGVSLDTTITPELKEEGVVRELIRTVQGLRQDANYHMSDEIVLMVDAPDQLQDLIQRNSVQIKKGVNAVQLELAKSDKIDAELTTKVDEWQTWVGVRKI